MNENKQGSSGEVRGTPTGGVPPSISDVQSGFIPMEGGTSFSNLLSKLLRKPLSIFHELETKEVLWKIPITLILIAVVSLTVFGFVVGTFSWGDQIWAAPLKIVSGLMFSALICLPSLYIFTCIGGLEARFSTVVGMLCSIVALSGLLLVGFAPAVWLFSVSSTSAIFIGFMLLALWIICVGFGFTLVFRVGKAMGMTNTGHLLVWCLIFLLVTVQMTTTLRPIVGESDRLFNFEEKKFFLQYWSEELQEATD
ncbi:MAG: hypothetical protein CME16_04005 [Gemmatimonadetes bacterium]|nr:hypothetical protein [Gemmatimonadota bacterium]